MMIAWMGGFANLGAHIHAMTALGLVMTSVLRLHRRRPVSRMRAALASGALAGRRRGADAGASAGGLQLVVGLATITVAILGHGVL